MKIPINLASQPFRRDRAMIVASTFVCLVLAASLGMLIVLANADSAQLGDIRRQIAGLKQEVQAVSGEQAKLNAVIHKPENETVLERSVFINTLLQRKGISWNQVFTDLEKTIPYNVKLVRIRPAVDEQGYVALDMTLASETINQMVDALKAFKESPLFRAAEWKNISPPAQTDPLYRLAITVTYAQKL
jgi:Tfp pilus assembly protein PilN